MKQLPTNVEQIWYVDDACACGKLGSLFQWWQHLCAVGASFNYFTNASKTWLITKENFLHDATQLLADG